MSPPDGGELDALAAQPMDERDRHLLATLAVAFDRRDPAPQGLAERMLFGLDLAGMHAELAELIELQSADDLVGARSDGVEQMRTVTFSSDSLTVMITISVVDSDTVRLDGWSAPPSPISIEIHVGESTLRGQSDSGGRFVFDLVPRGLAKLVFRGPAAPSDQRRSVVTPTISL